MNDGYIKLYRRLLENAIWTSCSPAQKVVMITILLMANHKPNEWTWKGNKYTVQSGQFISSLENIAQRSGKGISIQNVRSALSRLKSLQFLTDESTKTGRLITIENWALYQIEDGSPTDRPTDQSTKNQQTGNRQVTTNKNDNKDKNAKTIYSADFESFWTVYPRQTEKAAAFKCWSARIREGHSADEMISAARVYAITVAGKDPQYIKHAKTFIGPNKPFSDFSDQISQPEPDCQPEDIPPEYTAPMSCIEDYQ